MKNQSIKELVYDGILNDIIEGVYPANSILNERMLSEKYQVSKAPVREALVQLCGEGILNNIPRCGYQLPVITPRDIISVLEYRTMLEVSAMEKTIRIITPEEIGRLTAHTEKADKLALQKDIQIHWKTNVEFHLMLCECCDNSFVYKALENALKICSMVAAQYFTKTWEKSKLSDAKGHLDLVNAIRDKDVDGARELLTKDILSVKEEVLGG